MAAYKGTKYTNDAAPLLMEYNIRKRLAELGYRFEPKELSVFKAECFVMISSEIQRLQDAEMKRKR